MGRSFNASEVQLHGALFHHFTLRHFFFCGAGFYLYFGFIGDLIVSDK